MEMGVKTLTGNVVLVLVEFMVKFGLVVVVVVVVVGAGDGFGVGAGIYCLLVN